MSSDPPPADDSTSSADASSAEAPQPTDDSPTASDVSAGGQPDRDRRRFLTYGALAALIGSGAAGAWAVTRDDPDPEPQQPATTQQTIQETTTEPIPAPELVRRYAPDLYFGALEKWYPTDPREYLVRTDGKRVVDGFTALRNYTRAFQQTGTPPTPRVFYRVVEAAPGVDAIQYWLYSVFDQFTVNFHWHDWELLQVFVDRDTGTPLLLSASAHSRKVPNNEFLEPDLANERRPGILSEVGSHSSASELNTNRPSFDRLPSADWTSDITNDAVSIVTDLTPPFAYGLPRDEGGRLPFVMPELDGHALWNHPNVALDTSAFVDPAVTVDDWHGLPTPPETLPVREPGLVFAHAESQTSADVTYDLAPIGDLVPSDSNPGIEGFDGPQLSFEFLIPGFVEDLAASHITSVGIPWTQPRYDDPLRDVTDPDHRAAIDGAEPASLTSRVVGRVRELKSGTEGALDAVADGASEAVEDAASVSLSGLRAELAVQLASPDPVATVTNQGTFRFLHVEPTEHRLTINGPGVAPLAQGFEHDGGTTRAGAQGNLTVVANEDAASIKGDARDTDGIARLSISEAYAGPLFAGRPVEDDRFAVAVHEAGEYTVDVVDQNGRHGSYTVTPGDLEEGEHVRESIQAGKLSLARALRDHLQRHIALARRLAERDDARGTVIERLSAALQETEAAVSSAERGDPEGTNERLQSIRDHLTVALEALASDRRDGYTDASAAVLRPRIRADVDRVDLAIETPLA